MNKNNGSNDNRKAIVEAALIEPLTIAREGIKTAHAVIEVAKPVINDVKPVIKDAKEVASTLKKELVDLWNIFDPTNEIKEEEIEDQAELEIERVKNNADKDLMKQALEDNTKEGSLMLQNAQNVGDKISILQKKHQDNINIINSINPGSDVVMSGGRYQRQMQKGGKKILSRTHKSINEFLNSKITLPNILKRMTINKRKSKLKSSNKYKYKYSRQTKRRR